MENRFLLNDYPPPAGMSVYPRRSAAKICLGYAAAGWLWILLSDKAVALVTHDVETMVVLNSIKGSLFVLVTAAILYFLVYAQFVNCGAAEPRFRYRLSHVSGEK